MNGMTYLVYDGGELLAGFVSLCVAVTFIEEWRTNSNIPVDLVDANTGEVIDTYVNDCWENGD